MEHKIIAGPVLRRVERDEIVVWLATNSATEVEGMVYHPSDLASTLSAPVQDSQIKQVKLGDELYIHLVRLAPVDPNGFLTDAILFYDIQIGQKTLKDFGLIDGDKAINYPAFSLPSFLSSSLYCQKPLLRQDPLSRHC